MNGYDPLTETISPREEDERMKVTVPINDDIRIEGGEVS